MISIPVIMIIIMNLQPRPRGLIELNISESKRREKREEPETPPQQASQQQPGTQPEPSAPAPENTVSLSERREKLIVYQNCMVKDKNKV